jgi:hypothetical protein
VILNEKVLDLPISPLRLSLAANDWTHANVIIYSASDTLRPTGICSCLYAIRIGFSRSMTTTGNEKGRYPREVGTRRRFRFISGDPWPWFSHQHGPQLRESSLILHDNGKARVVAQGGDSRGRVLALDERALTATLLLNVDLGVLFSGLRERGTVGELRLSVSERLYQSCRTTQLLEVQPSGTATYEVRWQGTYRGFRLNNLYNYTP